MVLIYAHKTSARLQYTAAFIFKEVLRIPYSITEYQQGYEQSTSIKINYTGERILEDELIIPNYGLLHQAGIRKQAIEVFEMNGFPAFFKSTSDEDGFPFDIFSGIFYLISRYEEYLPYKADKYGRYSYGNSLAFQENFLHLPLVNIWLNYFAEYLKIRFPVFESNLPQFRFIPTYDVDRAYSWLQNGFLKNAAGTFQLLFTFRLRHFRSRMKVLTGRQKDPFDNFDWLNRLHGQYGLHPVYFFLVPNKNNSYDQSVSPANEKMQALIINTAKKYPVGLHPSWQSGDDYTLLGEEKKTLEKISGEPIEKSRQHYLRFSLPEGYRKLADAGITEDYSMGYGSINGFRASVAASFYWYDIEKEMQTKLKIFPFCYMDSAALNLELSADEAYDELMEFYTICQDVQGTFITISHNHLLGNDNPAWRSLYEKFLAKMAGEVSV